MPTAKNRVSRCLTLLFLLLLWGCGPSGDYPNAPISLICPWAVGGGTDRISRQVALYLEEALGVPVNVVNVTGGGGVTGHRHGARARPDGYTLTMMTVELNMLHWRNLTHLSWRDFTPVALINRDSAALFVRTDSPWKDLQTLTREIRQRPGELTASGTAEGGIWHLALAGWLSHTGLAASDVRWIPINGAAPSLQELVSGGLDVVSCSLPEAQTFLEAGQVRSLGVMAEVPVPGYEEIPTFRESGVDWALGTWRGIGLPGGTPKRVVEIVGAALRRIFQGQLLVDGRSLPELIQSQGFNVSWAGSEAFSALLDETDRELGLLLRGEQLTALRSRTVVGPMTFPKLLGAGLLVTLVGLLLIRPGGGSRVVPTAFSSNRHRLRFVETIVLLAALLLVLDTVGFVLAAGSFLLYLLWRLGNRLWLSALIAAILIPLLNLCFGKWLGIPLPRGWLGW